MADSHVAFLRTAETSFAGLSALLSGQPIAPRRRLAQQPAEASSCRAVVASPVVTPASVRAGEHADRRARSRSPRRSSRAPAPRQPVAPEPSRAASEPAAAAVDLEALMMSVVAEKTGYPAEMLGLHMDLEADLGIDSIKRVEILAAFRERAPGLPEVKADRAGDAAHARADRRAHARMQGAPASHPATDHGSPVVAPASSRPRSSLRRRPSISKR